MAPAGANGRPSGGVERPYGDDDVGRLRGTVQVEHTLARLGA
jgi:isocitrate lyase